MVALVSASTLQPQLAKEAASSSSSCTASQLDESEVAELLADIDRLEKERGDDEEVRKLANQAKAVRAWNAYVADLAHPTRRRDAVPPTLPPGTK